MNRFQKLITALGLVLISLIIIKGIYYLKRPMHSNIVGITPQNLQKTAVPIAHDTPPKKKLHFKKHIFIKKIHYAIRDKNFYGGNVLAPFINKMKKVQDSIINEYYQEAISDQSPSIGINGTYYKFIPGLAAVSHSDLKGIDPADIVSQLGGTYFVKRDEIDGDIKTNKVVYNPRLRRLGVITNNFNIRLKNKNALSQFQKTFPKLKLLSPIKNTNWYIFHIANPNNLINLQKVISKSKSVDKVKMGIYESEYIHY